MGLAVRCTDMYFASTNIYTVNTGLYNKINPQS